MATRTVPYDLEAEESVLGSMFLSTTALQKACESLNQEYFYSDKNSKIFTAMQALSEKKVPLDITTVTAELKQRNWLNEVGGVEYLTEIINFVPTAGNIDYYIKIVEDDAILRSLIQTATDVVTLGYEHEGSVNETLDEAERKLLNVIKNRKSGEFLSIKDVLYNTQKQLEYLANSKGEVTGLPSGFYDLDRITAGFHENELIIIAARPAMGKTAFALNIATHVAMNTDKTVAIFNLEMSPEQLAMRMLASLGQIDGNKLRTGYLLNDDWKKLNEAISQLQDAKMYIAASPGITIGEIRSQCRRLASSEEGLGLVVIDYLQLVSGGGHYGTNKQLEVSDISRSLKTMSLELHIPVIALAQLNRTVDSREDKKPVMSDLRDSGSIEQDADIVGFLYREDYYDKELRNEENNSKTQFLIEKNRSGSTGKVDLLFKKNTSTFVSLQKDEIKEKKGEKDEH